MISMLKKIGGRLYATPALLLVLAALFFGGNTVAGRLAVGHISPEQLVFLRWLTVLLMLAPVLRGRIVSAWQKTRPRMLWTFAMGAVGFTSFNTLFYAAAHKTAAINLGIIQGTIPAWVLAGAFIVHRARARAAQLAGVALTVFGVAVLASRGDLRALSSASFVNIGDMMMLAACFAYACYTVGLKNRPQMEGLEFFFILAAAALLSSLPLALYEMASGAARFPTAQGWLVLLYVAVFPSCLSQIFYIRGVELVGPERAGVFLNLVPVFAAACAVVLIDESLQWFQLAALALVVGGIWLSEKGGRRNG